MTYQQTINYLYTQLPMFSRIGSAAYKANLHNTITLCQSLGNPQQLFKSIHIAGTNGKGSTAHMLAAILQEAGYKTGLYTSPHIKDFRERIRVNGQMVPEQFIVDFVVKTTTITEQIKPSFFELTVAMAFDYFAAQKVDYAIIETGLGGLLDSTNVITPILSVITNIGYDHQNILGNTLQEIATQKAGIIKQNIPVVIGETLPETKQIFINTALQKNAEIFFAEDMHVVENMQIENNESIYTVSEIMTCKRKIYTLGLTGLYQSKNICTVLQSVAQLKIIGLNITENALQRGLQQVKQITALRGRWDVLQQHPTIIADVAHNKDGIAQVLRQLSSTYADTQIHFIIGFVNDKDVESVVQLFPKNATYYFTNAHIPRAMPAIELAKKAASQNLKGNIFVDVNMAIKQAKLNALKNDVIMICGSFFIISEIDDFDVKLKNSL